MQIGALEIQLFADVARIRRDMDDARRAVGDATTRMGKAADFAKGALAAIGGAISFGAMLSSVNEAITRLGDLDDMAQKTGSSVENLSRMQKVATVFETDMGKIDAAVVKLAKGMATADEEGSKARKALSALGISARDSAGDLRDPAEVMIQMATRLQNYKDGAAKTALINDALGKSGADLLPYLNDLAENYNKVSAESKESAAAAAAMQDQMGWAKLRLTELSGAIATAALPAINDLIGAFSDVVKEQNKMTGPDAAAWANDLAIGIARVADVAVLLPRILGAVSGSFKVVGADIGVVVAAAEMANPISAAKKWAAGGSPMADFNKAVDERNKVLAEANAKYDRLWNQPANQFEQAILKRIAERGKAVATVTQESNQEVLNYGTSVEKATGSTVKYAKSTIDLSKAIKDAADFEEKYGAALGMTADLLADRVKDAEAEAARSEELARTYGMTKLAIEEVELARLQEQLAQRSSLGLTLDEIETLEKLIAAKKRNVAAIGSVDSAEAAKKASDQQLADQVKLWDSIEQTAHDTFTSIQDGSAALWTRMKNTAKNVFFDWLYQMTAKKWLINVGTSMGLTGGAAGVAQAGSSAGGAGSMLSNASGLSGLANFGGSAIAGLGNLVGSSSLSAFGAGFAGNTMGMATTATEAFASMGMAAEAGAASFGAMASAALPWIGAAVAVFTLAKKAFSMGPKEFTGTSTLSGQITPDGLDAGMYADWTKQGGWLRSDKSGSDRLSVDAQLAAGITATYETIKASTADYAKVLGLNAEHIANRAQGISIAMGKDEAANQKAIADFFSETADNVAREVLPSMVLFQRAGETAAQTLQRMATNAVGVEQALWAIGIDAETAFGAVSNVSMLARERLVEFAGGLEAFAANTAGFQQSFLTEAERNAPVLKAVTDQLAALGLSAVDTRDEFKQVVLGLDLTTEAGAKQYGELMKMQVAFAQLYPVIDTTTAAAEKAAAVLQERASLQDRLDAMLMSTDQLREKEIRKVDESNQAMLRQIFAIEDLTAAREAEKVAIAEAAQTAKDRTAALLSNVDGAFSVLQTVVGREKALLQEVTGKHQALASALRGSLDSMNVSGNEREDRLGAQAQIRTALAIAKASGVLPDADSLKGALSVIGKDSSALFATQQDYLRDFYSTQNDIAALAGLTDSTLSVEEQSLKALDGILEGAQQQINALKGVDTSVLSLADAIRGWEVSLGAAQADPVASAGGGIAGLYKELLGRPADGAGLDYWKDAVAGGVSLEQVRKMIMESAEYKGIPGFANGGDHGGGMRWVGERGPELEFTGPSRIASHELLMRRLASPNEGNAALVGEVRRLVGIVEKQQQTLDRIAGSTGQLAEQFDEVSEGGNAMRTDVINVVQTKGVA